MMMMMMLSLSALNLNINVDGAFMSTSKSTFGSTSSVGSMNQVNSKFMGRGMKLQPVGNIQRKKNNNSPRKGTSLGMFLGADGILGVGAPEVAVTLLVGYFILGPSDLYKLTKEIGKFIQSFRTLSSEASKSFENTMENQLEMTEIRKAQTELNNAFSFRRSINTDESGAAFAEGVAKESASVATGGVAAAASTTTTTTTTESAAPRKRKRRRVKKKKVVPVEDLPPFTGDIPDLDMSKEFKDEFNDQLKAEPLPKMSDTAKEAERLRDERMDRLKNGQPSTPPDWYSASESDIASEVLSQQTEIAQPSPAEAAAQQSRFANQLAGDWNDQIMANEDKLSPLGKVMDRLAILEEEKRASDARLEEEFRLRAQNEEQFYNQKRKLLEEASAEIAASVYDFDSVTSESSYNFETESKSSSPSANVTKPSKDTKV
jgi:Sec-independent protein translocase protein TatA